MSAPLLFVIAVLAGWMVYIIAYHLGWNKGFDSADRNWRNK